MGLVLLAEIVTVSQALSATSSRNAKAALLADVLKRAAAEPPGAAADGTGVDEIAVVVRYLSGSLRQRRTGIELTHLTVLPAARGLPLGDRDRAGRRAAARRRPVRRRVLRGAGGAVPGPDGPADRRRAAVPHRACCAAACARERSSRPC